MRDAMLNVHVEDSQNEKRQRLISRPVVNEPSLGPQCKLSRPSTHRILTNQTRLRLHRDVFQSRLKTVFIGSGTN